MTKRKLIEDIDDACAELKATSGELLALAKAFDEVGFEATATSIRAHSNNVYRYTFRIENAIEGMKEVS